MKVILTLLVLSIAAPAAYAGRPSPKADPCDDAAYEYAVAKQKEDYPGKEFKKSNPSPPDVEQSEQKRSGFELWDVSYGVDEECREGYSILLRRSGDGKTCAVIKEASDSNRDCG